MNEDFGSDFISISDEDGVEYELEILDRLEHNGVSYIAAVTAGAGEDDEEVELIILKTIFEDGEELLSTPDDDDELNEVYELFMAQMYDDEDDIEE